MPTRQATVAAPEGLHARPAANFVQAVKQYDLEIWITKDGAEPVEADSMLSVMSLGAHCGDVVTLSAEGEGAEQALDELVTVLTQAR